LLKKKNATRDLLESQSVVAEEASVATVLTACISSGELAVDDDGVVPPGRFVSISVTVNPFHQQVELLATLERLHQIARRAGGEDGAGKCKETRAALDPNAVAVRVHLTNQVVNNLDSPISRESLQTGHAGNEHGHPVDDRVAKISAATDDVNQLDRRVDQESTGQNESQYCSNRAKSHSRGPVVRVIRLVQVVNHHFEPLAQLVSGGGMVVSSVEPTVGVKGHGHSPKPKRHAQVSARLTIIHVKVNWVCYNLSMKIGIDARFYGPRIGGGGLGRYVEELITNLQKLNTQNEYVIFLKKDNFHECKISNPRFRKVLADVPWYSLAEQFRMPKIIRDSKIDLMHYPHWNVPLFSQTPFIVTIHDLILLEDKKSARSSTRSKLVHGIKYMAFRTILEHAIHSSKKIVTISAYSKKSILKHFKVKKEKIEVIHNGFRPIKAEKSVDLLQLGVHEPYFLYVGNAYPHKNLNMLLHAFAQFAPMYKHVQLVIAGRKDMFSKQLESEARSLKIGSGQIIFIDLPTDDEIAKLYESANLFIFPSKIEGFGLPPLEALSHGTPIAVAHTSSLPEVVGDLGNYFEQDDIEQLVEYMENAVNYPQALKPEYGKIEEQLAKFSWEKCAEEVEKLYTKYSNKWRS
jgi:glycosyltransferase involved in cell wall biosynthesis